MEGQWAKNRWDNPYKKREEVLALTEMKTYKPKIMMTGFSAGIGQLIKWTKYKLRNRPTNVQKFDTRQRSDSDQQGK